MKHRCKVKLAPESIKNSKVNDEHLFRALARKMVSEMPLDQLHKLNMKRQGLGAKTYQPNPNTYKKLWAESVALWDGAKAEETKWM